MQIEVRIVGPDQNVPQSERKSVSIETHVRRGDAFNIQKVDTVIEGDKPVTFTVPEGGRLILTTPQTHETMVYDRDQSASVMPSRQSAPTTVVADKPIVPPPPPQNTAQPRVQTAQQPQPTVPTAQPRPGQPNPTEATKAAQQTAAGRPAGEKPPLPGSPVGSPPAGNEGKDNK